MNIGLKAAIQRIMNELNEIEDDVYVDINNEQTNKIYWQNLRVSGNPGEAEKALRAIKTLVFMKARFE